MDTDVCSGEKVSLVRALKEIGKVVSRALWTLLCAPLVSPGAEHAHLSGLVTPFITLSLAFLLLCLFMCVWDRPCLWKESGLGELRQQAGEFKGLGSAGGHVLLCHMELPASWLGQLGVSWVAGQGDRRGKSRITAAYVFQSSLQYCHRVSEQKAWSWHGYPREAKLRTTQQ